MAHYINPAFCQKSEILQPLTSNDANNIKLPQNRYLQSFSKGNEQSNIF